MQFARNFDETQTFRFQFRVDFFQNRLINFAILGVLTVTIETTVQLVFNLNFFVEFVLLRIDERVDLEMSFRHLADEVPNALDGLSFFGVVTFPSGDLSGQETLFFPTVPHHQELIDDRLSKFRRLKRRIEQNGVDERSRRRLIEGVVKNFEAGQLNFLAAQTNQIVDQRIFASRLSMEFEQRVERIFRIRQLFEFLGQNRRVSLGKAFFERFEKRIVMNEDQTFFDDAEKMRLAKAKIEHQLDEERLVRLTLAEGVEQRVQIANDLTEELLIRSESFRPDVQHLLEFAFLRLGERLVEDEKGEEPLFVKFGRWRNLQVLEQLTEQTGFVDEIQNGGFAEHRENEANLVELFLRDADQVQTVLHFRS